MTALATRHIRGPSHVRIQSQHTITADSQADRDCISTVIAAAQSAVMPAASWSAPGRLIQRAGTNATAAATGSTIIAVAASAFVLTLSRACRLLKGNGVTGGGTAEVSPIRTLRL